MLLHQVTLFPVAIGGDLICGLWLVEELCIELEAQQCTPNPQFFAGGRRHLFFGREVHQVGRDTETNKEIDGVGQRCEPFQGPMVSR